MENLLAMLAGEFSRRGIEVVVVTETPNPDPDGFPYEVLRNARPLTLWKYYRRSDIYLQFNLNIRMIWPLMLWPKKWVVSYHITYFDNWRRKRPSLMGWLKKTIARLPRNIAVSDMVGRNLGLKKYDVILNPYDDSIFRDLNLERKRDILFVGRLVDEKGCDLLIEAFAGIARDIPQTNLTVVGDGPERENLERLTADLGICDRVSFRGSLDSGQIAREMNGHLIHVVPSVYNEAFGIVALEGLACGCRVVVSDGDGLQEASGGFGYTFTKGDRSSLRNALMEALSAPVSGSPADIETYLAGRRKENVAKEYMQYFNHVLSR